MTPSILPPQEPVNRLERNIKCVSCGHFLRIADYFLGRCEVEPPSEFGPERVEWLCTGCAARERNEKDAA